MSEELESLTKEERLLITDSEVYQLNSPEVDSESASLNISRADQTEVVEVTEKSLRLTDLLGAAAVGADGTLIRKNSAKSAKRLGKGIYEVIFSRKVNRGFYLATLASYNYYTPTGEVTVVPRSNNEYGLYVVTRDSSGVREDRSFHVAVVQWLV